MKKTQNSQPGIGCNLILLTVIVFSCVVMLSLRSCALSCGLCDSCSLGTAEEDIDTSAFVDPSTKNNLDLAAWAEMAYEQHWGYVYGTWGSTLTEQLLQTKAGQYPTDVGGNMEYIRTRWMGRRVADCIGLIKGYCWYTPSAGFEYCGNGMPDIGANKMYENASVKGEIGTIPETPGLAVWVKGHIGVYVGDGWVIEAMSTVDGVRKTRIEDRPWTHWLRIPYIDYIEYTQTTLG